MGSYHNQPEFATNATEIIPSDTMDATTFLDGSALYLGIGGDVRVIMKGVEPNLSNSVTFAGAVDGSFLPIIVDYVLATNTTADKIIAVK